MNKVRIDKWLWSVRIFKSRTIATEMCRTGKIKIRGTTVKPSYLLILDDLISVRKNGYEFQFKVKELLYRRVSAPLAQKAYDDLTPVEELNKYEAWFVGKASGEKRLPGSGRPTKLERRLIDRFKENYYFED